MRFSTVTVAFLAVAVCLPHSSVWAAKSTTASHVQAAVSSHASSNNDRKRKATVNGNTNSDDESDLDDGDESDLDDNVDINTKIDDMYLGWANTKCIARMKELMESSDEDLSPIRLHTKNYLKYLLTCNDGRINHYFAKGQKKLGDFINKLSKSEDEGNWAANFGEILTKLTEGLVMANYAPTSDCEIQELMAYCRIPRNNPCMIMFVKVSLCTCYIL